MFQNKLALLVKQCPGKMNLLVPLGATNTKPIQSRGMATEASFDTAPYKLHRLDEGPSSSMSCTRDEALKYYKSLAMIRRMESAAGNLYKEKAVRGFCHLYSGQEAICVGMVAALRSQDSVVTAYRDHSWVYAMGASVHQIIAELLGKSTGTTKGKGGSMHMYIKNFYGGNGIVGAQVPVGAGLALAHKYKEDGGVSVALYGDGAANQGQIYEAYNIAKLWDLPAIFVCENNGFGMGTSVDRASASTEYYTRGDYVPGLWADGMDVLSMKEATRFAIEHCTTGKGPIIIEATTYRYSGHSMSDPGTSYRSREEIQEVRQTRDPIMLFKEKITNAGLVTTEELKKIDLEIRKEVDSAVKSAKSDKELGVQELATDVYYNPLETTIRGVNTFTPYHHKRVNTPWNDH